jgi:flagellar biosynthesis anti-sigma factor FlgM
VTIIPNGGKDPQRTHEVGGSTRTPRAARPQGTPGEAAAGSTPNSSLNVSAHGERFVSLRARLEGLEASRAERVERLRQLVAAGEYQPDSEEVAAAMLADPATAAALGMGSK